MPQNPPEGMPAMTPLLYFRELASALDWLSKALGFETRSKLAGPDGALVHAEMQLGDAVIMLGPPSDEENTRSPSDLPAVSQSLYVYVDDVDAHFANAKAQGATITLEPEDKFWGDRMYSAIDFEGHHWSFATHVKDVAPEDMHP